MKKLFIPQTILFMLFLCAFSLCSLGQEADTLSDEEKRLVQELAKSLKNDVNTSNSYQNDAFKAEPIYRTPENEKYIEEGMSFNKDGLESGSVERQYQQILRERKEKTERNIIIIAICLICTLAVFLIIKEKKNNVTGLQSKIKTVNEEALKQNLDLKNSAVTEVDNETLKKKLGL